MAETAPFKVRVKDLQGRGQALLFRCPHCSREGLVPLYRLPAGAIRRNMLIMDLGRLSRCTTCRARGSAQVFIVPARY